MYLHLLLLIFILTFLFFLSQKKKEPKKYLVMYSGGLDSLFILHYLLKNNKNVHIHHVILEDNTDRWKAEYNLVKKVIEKLKEIYPFEYSESYNSYKNIDKNLYFTQDTDTNAVIALHMALINNCDAIATGHLPPEKRFYDKKVINGIINLLCDAKEIKNKPILIDFPKLQLKNYNEHEKILLSNIFKDEIYDYINKNNKNQNRFNEYLDIIYDIYRYKLAEYQALPPELRDLYTGCRFPKIEKDNIIFCEKCINCKYRKLLNSSF